MTHIQKMFWIHLFIWISRLFAFIAVYMLHTWLSIIILLWLLHSFLIKSLLRFRVTTVRFYLPLIILIYLWEFTVNVDMLFPDYMFDEDALKSKQYTKWGIIRFDSPLLPLGCFNLLIYTMFYWIKLSENISKVQDDNSLLG